MRKRKRKGTENCGSILQSHFSL